jgi:glycosyltransferase involved in cell wall biosynthesis
MTQRNPTAAAPVSISIVLPNYNHAEELKTSLAAILAQKRPADEIVVVDDGSEDDSVSLIERFATASPAIRLVRHPQRLGVAAAVNRGLQEARHDYVILTSADEKIDPEMTSALGEAIVRFPQAELGVSLYQEWFPETGRVNVYDRTSVSGMWYAPGDAPFFVGPEQLLALLRQQIVFLHVNTAIFRRQALLDVGGFAPELRWHGDWFAIYAIALRSGFCAVPRALSYFRVDERSYSARGISDPVRQQEVMLNIIAKLNAPKFAYFRDALREAPSPMSPFMRGMLVALAKRPQHYPELVWILRWWLRELARGRRPAAWAALVQRLCNARRRSRSAP